MTRKRKGRKRKTYRWSFVLMAGNDRHEAIHELLDELAADDEASEFIRSAVYEKMQRDGGVPMDSDVTLDDIADRLAAIQNRLDSAGAVRPNTLPEMSDNREMRAGDRLRNLTFKKGTDT